MVAFEEAAPGDDVPPVGAAAPEGAPEPDGVPEPEPGAGLDPVGAKRLVNPLAASSELRYQSFVTEGSDLRLHSRSRTEDRKAFQSLHAGAGVADMRTLPGVEPMFCTVNLE